MCCLRILYGDVYGSEEFEKTHSGEARQDDRTKAICVQTMLEIVQSKRIAAKTFQITCGQGGEEYVALQVVHQDIYLQIESDETRGEHPWSIVLRLLNKSKNAI